MTFKMLRVEQTGRILKICVNNPPMNYGSFAMVAEMKEVISQLKNERSVGAVIFTGDLPGYFINHFSGGDVGESGDTTLSVETAAFLLNTVSLLTRLPGVSGLLRRTPLKTLVQYLDLQELFLLMNRLDKVFIAAINGQALGFGFELSLACDIRYVAKGDFWLGGPEASVALMSGGGGTQRLSRLIGPGKAVSLLIDGRTFTPQEALELGIVHRLTEPHTLLAETEEVAERLARRSPNVVALIKRAIYEGGSLSLEEGLRIERSGFLHLATRSLTREVEAIADKMIVELDSQRRLTPAQQHDLFELFREGKVVDMTKEG